jgi:hypothetical protein
LTGVNSASLDNAGWCHWTENLPVPVSVGPSTNYCVYHEGGYNYYDGECVTVNAAQQKAAVSCPGGGGPSLVVPQINVQIPACTLSLKIREKGIGSFLHYSQASPLVIDPGKQVEVSWNASGSSGVATASSNPGTSWTGSRTFSYPTRTEVITPGLNTTPAWFDLSTPGCSDRVYVQVNLPQPNLTASNVVQTGTLTPGSAISANGRVSNNGGANAAASITSFAVYSRATGASVFNFSNVSTSAINASSNTAVTTNAGNTWSAVSGTYFIRMCADATGLVSESDETIPDNCDDSPDFTISTASVSCSAAPSTTAAGGGSVTYTASASGLSGPTTFTWSDNDSPTPHSFNSGSIGQWTQAYTNTSTTNKTVTATVTATANVTVTGTCQVTVTGVTALPNLYSFNVSQTGTPTVGSAIGATGWVGNNGAANAGASNTRYTVVNNSTGTTVFTFNDVPTLSINAGGSTSLNTSNTWTATAGTYYIRQCADATNAVVESNEGDNCANAASTFTVTNPQPDLAPSSVSPVGTLQVGNTIRASTLVTNMGQATAGTSHGMFTLYNASTGQPVVSLTQVSIPSLTTSQQTSITSTDGWAANISGTFYYHFVADNLNEVAEANEANNWADSPTFTVSPASGCSINVSGREGGTSNTFSTSPVTVGYNGAAELQWVGSPNGTIGTPTASPSISGWNGIQQSINTTATTKTLSSLTSPIYSTVGLNCTGADGVTRSSNIKVYVKPSTPTLAAPSTSCSGTNTQVNLSWTASTLGTSYKLYDTANPGVILTTVNTLSTSYTIAAGSGAHGFYVVPTYTNADGVVIDGNGSNIQPVTPIVGCGTAPNLYAFNVSQTGTLTAGSPITPTGWVGNNGTANAGSSNSTFSIINTSTGSSVYTNTVSTLALNTGASTSLTSSGTWSAVSGTYYVRLCADSGSAIPESNEGDNCANSPNFTIPAASGITLDPITKNTCSDSATLTRAVLSWNGPAGLYNVNEWNGSGWTIKAANVPSPYTYAVTNSGSATSHRMRVASVSTGAISNEQSFVENVCPFDFSVSVSPNMSIACGGGSATNSVTITNINGAPAIPVTVTASGLPTGAIPSFNPVRCTPGNNVGNTCTVPIVHTVTANSVTPCGVTTPITVTGTDTNNKQHTAQYNLTIQSNPTVPACNLLVNGQKSITVDQGTPITFTWGTLNTVSCSNDFGGGSACSNSTGYTIQAGLGPNTYYYHLNGTSSSGATCQDTVTVVSSSGPGTQDVSCSLIKSPSDQTLVSSVNVSAGQGPVKVMMRATQLGGAPANTSFQNYQGFGGINAYFNGVPGNPFASCTPGSGTFSPPQPPYCNEELDIQADASVPLGSYNIAERLVQGGDLNGSNDVCNLTVNVVPAPDISTTCVSSFGGYDPSVKNITVPSGSYITYSFIGTVHDCAYNPGNTNGTGWFWAWMNNGSGFMLQGSAMCKDGLGNDQTFGTSGGQTVVTGTQTISYNLAAQDAISNKWGYSNPPCQVLTVTGVCTSCGPSGLTYTPTTCAQSGPGIVNLSWNAASGATGYKIYRCNHRAGHPQCANQSDYSVIATVGPGTTYQDRGGAAYPANSTLSNGGQYAYRVSALYNSTESNVTPPWSQLGLDTVASSCGNMSATCAVNPGNITPPQNASWNSTASGGTGSYNFNWNDSVLNTRTRSNAQIATWPNPSGSVSDTFGPILYTTNSPVTMNLVVSGNRPADGSSYTPAPVTASCPVLTTCTPDFHMLTSANSIRLRQIEGAPGIPTSASTTINVIRSSCFSSSVRLSVESVKYPNGDAVPAATLSKIQSHFADRNGIAKTSLTNAELGTNDVTAKGTDVVYYATSPGADQLIPSGIYVITIRADEQGSGTLVYRKSVALIVETKSPGFKEY